MPCRVKSVEGRRIDSQAGHAYVKERFRLSERKKRELVDYVKWTEIGMERRVGSVICECYKEFVQRKAEITFESTKDKQ